MRIAIVIPYFGSWPSYFPLFLKGCATNKWLDIYFFTNCPIPSSISNNIFFISSSLQELSELASKELNFDFEITNSYKLCDLKPFYGLIFQRYLKSYDYCGYGDIDVIYGDLKSFILPRIEEGFDVISCRKEILSGSFALFRNTREIIRLATQISDYWFYLKSNKYFALDETAHSHIVWNGGSKLDLPDHCFTKVVAQYAEQGSLKVSFENVCKEYLAKEETLLYQQAKLISGENHFGYYHSVLQKNKPYFFFPTHQDIPNDFVITTTGFYTLHAFRFYSVLRHYRYVAGMITWYYRRGIKLLQRLAKRGG